MKKSIEGNTTQLKRLSTIAVILSLSALLIATIALIQYRNEKNNNVSLQSEISKYYWMPGEEALSPQFGIKVVGLSKDSEGIPGYLPVAEGYQFLTLEMQVRNITDSSKTFLPQDHLFITDKNNNRYDITVVPEVETPIAGSLEPYTIRNGQVGFSVPADIKQLHLNFEPYGPTASIPVIIDLSTYL